MCVHMQACACKLFVFHLWEQYIVLQYTHHLEHKYTIHYNNNTLQSILAIYKTVKQMIIYRVVCNELYFS